MSLPSPRVPAPSSARILAGSSPAWSRVDPVGGVSPTHPPKEALGKSPELLARVGRPGYVAAWAKEAALDLWRSHPHGFLDRHQIWVRVGRVQGSDSGAAFLLPSSQLLSLLHPAGDIPGKGWTPWCQPGRGRMAMKPVPTTHGQEGAPPRAPRGGGTPLLLPSPPPRSVGDIGQQRTSRLGLPPQAWQGLALFYILPLGQEMKLDSSRESWHARAQKGSCRWDTGLVLPPAGSGWHRAPCQAGRDLCRKAGKQVHPDRH